jgi:peptidoglycan/LPS O-acetylase OafA/YrhL
MSSGAQDATLTDDPISPDGRGRPVRFGFVPALDGLRAVAVLGVMLYHGGAPFAGGGFLSIDVFFVLSGFLITTLLIGEWGARLTIGLGQFWARRARRLLPALLVMLVGVAIYAKVFATPGEFANLRLDSLSTLFYVSNWHFIFGGSDYFNFTAQPSPLQHMWSLSIEEQFYIVWPPVTLLVLRLSRSLRPSRRLWPIFGVAVLGAIASAIDMRLSYQGGASITRLYEGTDTRSQDILIGAALAIGMAIWAEHRPSLTTASFDRTAEQTERSHPSAGTTGKFPPRPHRRDRYRRRGPGIRPIAAWEISSSRVRLALQVAGWSACMVALYLGSHVVGWSPVMFEGGYFLFALGVAAVIFCVATAQRAPLARALGNPVLGYVGKISYGTYLWHFPLFAFLSAQRLQVYGYPLLLIRICVTLLVATASFYLVEEPVRQRRFLTSSEWRAWLATSAAFLSVVAVTLAATVPSTAEAASTGRLVGADYTGPPVKVLLFGDSVTWRIGFSMLASQPELTYNVNLDNGAIIGCGVVRSSEYRGHGEAAPVTPQCNTSTPRSGQWPAQWRGDLEQFQPNVVILLAGRWEVSDRLIGGKWMHIGEPAFDADLRQSLEQAVQVGTSTGALMVLMTSPCFNSGEQDNGQPWPEDSPTRLAEYNAMVRQVAAGHPTTVQLDDFGSQLCPGGVYTPTIGGTQVRDGDGVHVPPTPAAGQWLDARVLPEAIRVGRLQMDGRRFAPPGVPTSSSSPSRSPVLAAGGGNLRGS